MDAIFGPDRVIRLQRGLPSRNPAQRRSLVLEALLETVRDCGARYWQPFCFMDERRRVTHYLVFITKHPRGYSIMKEIMAGESSLSEQGVPSFGYCRADQYAPLLLEAGRPLDDLPDLLLSRFAGRTLTVQDLFDRHNVGTPYVLKNYQTVLKHLEEGGRIKCAPPAAERRANSMAKHVKVTFPE